MRTCHTQSSGAQWRLGWRKGVSAFQYVLRLSGNSTNHCCLACGAYHFSSPPCMRMPPTHSCLLPSSSLGPHSRRPSLASVVQHVTTCRACGSGTLRHPACSFLDISRLFRAAVASLLPWSARTHPDQLELWSARTHHLPLRRLALVSRSVGLSPTLSLPFSLALPFSFSPVAPLCSFPTVRYPLSLSLSLSLFLSPSLSRPLSRAQKGGFGLFGASLSPPGFEPSSTG